MSIVKIDLYTAPWCAPCKVFKPKIEALANLMAIPLSVKNIEDEIDPNVKSVPTTVLHFKDGSVSYFAGANVDMIDTTISEASR